MPAWAAASIEVRRPRCSLTAGHPTPLLCHPRSVEAQGGLDKYLLSTPDRHLHSDVASALKWELLCKVGRPFHSP